MPPPNAKPKGDALSFFGIESPNITDPNAKKERLLMRLYETESAIEEKALIIMGFLEGLEREFEKRSPINVIKSESRRCLSNLFSLIQGENGRWEQSSIPVDESFSSNIELLEAELHGWHYRIWFYKNTLERLYIYESGIVERSNAKFGPLIDQLNKRINRAAKLCSFFMLKGPNQFLVPGSYSKPDLVSAEMQLHDLSASSGIGVWQQIKNVFSSMQKDLADMWQKHLESVHQSNKEFLLNSTGMPEYFAEVCNNTANDYYERYVLVTMWNIFYEKQYIPNTEALKKLYSQAGEQARVGQTQEAEQTLRLLLQTIDQESSERILSYKLNGLRLTEEQKQKILNIMATYDAAFAAALDLKPDEPIPPKWVISRAINMMNGKQLEKIANIMGKPGLVIVPGSIMTQDIVDAMDLEANRLYPGQQKASINRHVPEDKCGPMKHYQAKLEVCLVDMAQYPEPVAIKFANEQKNRIVALIEFYRHCRNQFEHEGVRLINATEYLVAAQQMIRRSADEGSSHILDFQSTKKVGRDLRHGYTMLESPNADPSMRWCFAAFNAETKRIEIHENYEYAANIRPVDLSDGIFDYKKICSWDKFLRGRAAYTLINTRKPEV